MRRLGVAAVCVGSRVAQPLACAAAGAAARGRLFGAARLGRPSALGGGLAGSLPAAATWAGELGAALRLQLR
eukprot:359285-Chlamydomonas_euryale.AAC.4